MSAHCKAGDCWNLLYAMEIHGNLYKNQNLGPNFWRKKKGSLSAPMIETHPNNFPLMKPLAIARWHADVRAFKAPASLLQILLVRPHFGLSEGA